MDKYETIATHNIAETCCDSISLGDLSELSTREDETQNFLNTLLKKKLGYGSIRGSPEFRENVAELYSSLSTLGKLPAENILITPGGNISKFPINIYIPS